MSDPVLVAIITAMGSVLSATVAAYLQRKTKK